MKHKEDKENKDKPKNPWYMTLFESGAAARAGEKLTAEQKRKQERLDEITGNKLKK